MTKKCLLDLPVFPLDRDRACGTDIILDTFVKERNNVSSVEELLDFINIWKNIWILTDKITKEEYDIVDMAFDLDLVFDAFRSIINKEEGLDPEDTNVKIAMNLCMPHSSLQAFFLSKKYGVGSDLGFVRLYLDPYPEHMDALR